MITFKRIFALILIFVMLASATSCGEYNKAKVPDNSTDNNNTSSGENDNDTTDDFSVQLVTVNGEKFSPVTKVEIYWNDGYNVHKAEVDENGYASVDGLDGDYSVTLSSVPEGYAYDANGYKATNLNRHIEIIMHDLNLLKGQGTTWMESYEIFETGVYTITVKEEGDFSFIRFVPQRNGTYTVESWISVVEDAVNPLCKAYYGSSHHIHGEYDVETVGICGSYTRNFVHTVKIADENISSGGSQTFTFAIGAETKSGAYPVNITFAIKRDGDFDFNRADKTVVIPSHDWSGFDFDAFYDLAGGKLVGPETLYPNTENSYMFDEDNYKVWPVSEGGDGVYHVYNPEKYPETDGYGPILVAYITEACRYLDRSFTTIEDAGGSYLVVNGIYNYRLFIKGIEQMASQGYFCVEGCPCHEDNSDEENPETDDSNKLRACLTGCPNCDNDCTNVTAEEMECKGYAALVNSDGVAPVTPELAECLQGLAITHRYFADGDGWVESGSSYPIDAYEDSQWLFACAYYEE